jgi:hypothetical protein
LFLDKPITPLIKWWIKLNQAYEHDRQLLAEQDKDKQVACPSRRYPYLILAVNCYVNWLCAVEGDLVFLNELGVLC